MRAFYPNSIVSSINNGNIFPYSASRFTKDISRLKEIKSNQILNQILLKQNDQIYKMSSICY